IRTPIEMFGDSEALPNYIEMSPARPGYMAVTSGVNALAVSFDYGTTWNVSAMNGSAFPVVTGSQENWGTVSVNPNNQPGSVGHLYASVQGWLMKSVDWGLTWDLVVVVPSGWSGQTMVIPHLKKTGEINAGPGMEALWMRGIGWGGGSTGSIYRNPDGGFTWETLDVTPAGQIPIGAPGRNTI